MKRPHTVLIPSFVLPLLLLLCVYGCSRTHQPAPHTSEHPSVSHKTHWDDRDERKSEDGDSDSRDADSGVVFVLKKGNIYFTARTRELLPFLVESVKESTVISAQTNVVRFKGEMHVSIHIKTHADIDVTGLSSSGYDIMYDKRHVDITIHDNQTLVEETIASLWEGCGKTLSASLSVDFERAERKLGGGVETRRFGFGPGKSAELILKKGGAAGIEIRKEPQGEIAPAPLSKSFSVEIYAFANEGVVVVCKRSY